MLDRGCSSSLFGVGEDSFLEVDLDELRDVYALGRTVIAFPSGVALDNLNRRAEERDRPVKFGGGGRLERDPTDGYGQAHCCPLSHTPSPSLTLPLRPPL